MQTWSVVAVRVGVVLTVLAVALQEGLGSATYLFGRRRKLANAVLAMDVVLPLFVVAMIALGGLRGPVAIALMALALSPIPPVLPRKVARAGGSSSYMMELLVTAALIAVVFVPFAVWLLGRVAGSDLDVPSAQVALLLAGTVLAPVALGVLVHREAPAFSVRASRPVSLVGVALLVAGALPIIVASTPAALALVGNGTVLAIVAFTLVGLAAGHLLGGPDPDERTALAFTTASRHPGVAFLIAGAYLPEKKQAVAAIVLYLIVSGLATLPYQIWARRRHARLAHAAR